MAKIINFPGLEQRMAEQSAPAISQITNVIIEDTMRHLQQYHAELLQEYGADLIHVWGSFLLNYMARISYEEAVKAVGSEEKYNVLMNELSRNI